VLAQCPARADQVSELADKIREEVRRANYMVLNFMNYGRPLKLRKGLIRYDELLERTLQTLSDRLAEQQVRVVRQLEEDLPPLLLDAELMRNCIANFITNAAQAMPGGGEILLGAALDHDRSGWLILTFRDQGNGIAAEDLDKIFQPYFTTKEVGIGLGLAITERIVKEHGGEIEVESSYGEGTTFTVRLPIGEDTL